MFDAIRFLTDYRIETLRGGKNSQPGWINIRCPLCGDHSDHGGFKITGGYYHCWRCGGSTIAWVIQHLLNVPYSEAKKIEEQYSDYVQSVDPEPNIEHRPFNLPGKEIDDRYREYLIGRGFDPDLIVRKYGILGTGKIGELAHRLIIPIYYEGAIVSWQARAIHKGVDRKYLACPNAESRIDIKTILYNLDNCPKRRAFVVEGVTDTWRIGDQSCATFGVASSMEQAKLLRKRFDELYILFDPEPEAQKRAGLLAFNLAMLNTQAILVDPGWGHDPGSATSEEIEELRDALEL